MINLNKYIYKSIKKHALDCLPVECCGLLVEDQDNTLVFPCENKADDKLNSFLVSPNDYILAASKGKIIALYHSHTSQEHDQDFTILDKLTSISHKLPIILYNIIEDKFTLFDKKELNYQYIGTRFEYNKNDCLSLVEKYYRNEFNIILPIYERNDKTIDNNPLLFIENIDNYGFKILEVDENLKNGDIIIVNSLIGPTHLMIYIGNNQVLHNRENSYSMVEIYDNFYKNNTYTILRHNKLWI